jgi:DNA-binding NarL/FixJ family response regulator
MPSTFGVSSSYPRIQWASQLNRIRVLLADDHPGFPEIAEHFLEPEFEVVSKVVDGQALVEEAMRLKPDIVVTDISMPILNGIEAADRLKESGSKSRIVFLTVHTDADFIRRCLSTGAFGYVVKSRIATDLVPAIRQALAGHIFVSCDLPHESQI